MKRLLLAIAILWSRPGHAEPQRLDLELGLGGTPAGRVGLRGLVHVGEYDTAISFGGGVGLTGAIATVGVDQPFAHRTVGMKRSTYTLDAEYSVYATYALGHLAPWNREPFGVDEMWLVDGNYHWVDAGLAMRFGGDRFYLGMGIGVTVLVDHPNPIGVEMTEDEDLLWPLFPEGWTRQAGWGPQLWSNVGVRL